jgi:tetratricopeptide (TPR) repeat protein
VFAWHAPIDAGNFSVGWERIGNQAPTEDEFVGFVEYLKRTDFPRYLEFNGLDVKSLTQKANEHYQRGYALGSENKRKEAIAEYSQAVELFPFFYEAIDNRALTYMELGEHRAALSDFEESLRVNPEGITAFFSKGECLLKLGDLKAARAVFKEGKARFPEKRDLFDDFLKLAQRMT